MNRLHATATGTSVNIKSLVGFRIGEVTYALDIHRVREIIKPLPTLPLPHSPPAVVGVADHRGEVVPVIDLRRRFGLDTARHMRSTRWVIVKVATSYAGLVVDAVTGVFGQGVPEQRSAPHLGTGDAERGIAAVYKHEGQLVFALDVDLVTDVVRQVDVEQFRQAAGAFGGEEVDL